MWFIMITHGEIHEQWLRILQSIAFLVKSPFLTPICHTCPGQSFIRMKSTSLGVLLMITEEEICHQNNNFFDLLHPNRWWLKSAYWYQCSLDRWDDFWNEEKVDPSHPRGRCQNLFWGPTSISTSNTILKIWMRMLDSSEHLRKFCGVRLRRGAETI